MSTKGRASDAEEKESKKKKGEDKGKKGM